MEIRPLTLSEQKYTYAQSTQIGGQTGNIGHLRGDFAHSGYGFYTTWFDNRAQWKTDEFKSQTSSNPGLTQSSTGCVRIRCPCTTAMIWLTFAGSIKTVPFRGITARSMVSVWIRKNMLSSCGAIPQRAITIFTVSAM